MKTSEINLKFRTGVSPKQEAKASKSLVASVKKLHSLVFWLSSGEVGSAFFSDSEPRVR
jgi:hypothetical protein